MEVELTVMFGTLHLRRLALEGVGEVELKPGKSIGAGKTVRLRVKR